MSEKNTVSKTGSYLPYKTFGFALITSTILFILLAILMPISYETDDDVAMLLIASGSYSGMPDAHLVFINYTYGLLLKLFYVYLPGVEWYTIFFSVIHVVSMSIIYWCIVNTKKRFSQSIIFIILFCIIEAWNILQLQFTTTAALCTTAGMILFLSKQTLSHRITAILLCLLASLIRFEATYLVLCICTPLIVLQFLETKKKVTYILLFVGLVVSSFALKQYDSYVYKKDPAWAEYKEYNYYRGRINDNPNSLFLEKLPNNISRADYALLLASFPDANIFDNKTVRDIHSRIDGVSFNKKKENISNAFDEYYIWFIAITCLVCIQYIFIRNKNKRLLLLLSFLLLILVASLISLNGLFKFSVFMAAILPFWWILFVTQENDNTKVFYSSVIVILYSYLFGNYIHEEKKEKRHISKTVNVESNTLLNKSNLKNDEFIVGFSSSMRIEATNPYTISEKFKKEKFLRLGWLSKIPFHSGRFDSYLDLIDKNAICIGKDGCLPVLEKMQKSVLNNYNIHLDYKILLETDNLYLIRLIHTDESKNLSRKNELK